MPISNKDTIMNALKTALESITITNGYQQEIVEVIESPVVLPDIANKPGIRFYSDESVRKYIYFGSCEQELHIWIWGYVEAQPEDWDNLRKLEADIEKCLDTEASWSYREDTDLMRFSNHFGGVDQMAGIVEIEMVLRYQYVFASP